MRKNPFAVSKEKRVMDFDRTTAGRTAPKPYGSAPLPGANVLLPLTPVISPDLMRNRLLELITTLVAGACLVVLLVGSLPYSQ